MDALTILLKAKDEASKVFDRVKNNLEKIEKVANITGQGMIQMGTAAVIAGGLIMGMATSGVIAFGNFQESITNVSTLLDGQAVEAVASYEKGVLDMMKVIPRNADELGAGLYDVVSAGIEGTANQLKLLEKSAKLGVAGLGTTREAVDLVTSSINAFGLEGDQTEKVYDQIFKTVKNGKTTISELSQGFGAVAGTVAGAGIELDEYLASVAALTTTGQPAAQAHTQIKAAISGLTRETKDSKKVFDALGAESFSDLIQKSGGMVNAFDLVTKELGGNEAAILKLFGSTEAYNAVLGLTGNQNEKFTQTLNDMRKGANAVDGAFEKQTATWNSFTQLLMNRLNIIFIRIGDSLAPALMDLGKRFYSVIDAVTSFVENNPQLIKTIAMAGVVLTALGGVLVGVGGFIIWLSGTISSLMVAWTTLQPILMAGGVVFAGLSAPVWAIIGAIAGLIAIGVVIYTQWETILPYFQILWQHLTNTVLSEVIPAFQGVWSSLQELWQLIEPYVIPTLMVLAGILGGAVAVGTFIFIQNLKILGDVAKRVVDLVISQFKAMERMIKGAIDLVVGIITGDWSRAMDGLKNIGGGAVDMIVGKFQFLSGVISDVVGGIGNAVSKVKELGGNIAGKIPGFAVGTSHFSGGMAMVGERGPELVNLPAGSKVQRNEALRGGQSQPAPTVNFSPVINISTMTGMSMAETKKFIDTIKPELVGVIQKTLNKPQTI